mmetsp:Transcript_63471/g.183959  ORF Transcript_63471/g.183959 Transcript_63471/m.183959 type:complete len:200 (+) Transcript_63471:347-946(+)
MHCHGYRCHAEDHCARREAWHDLMDAAGIRDHPRRQGLAALVRVCAQALVACAEPDGFTARLGLLCAPLVCGLRGHVAARGRQGRRGDHPQHRAAHEAPGHGRHLLRLDNAGGRRRTRSDGQGFRALRQRQLRDSDQLAGHAVPKGVEGVSAHPRNAPGHLAPGVAPPCRGPRKRARAVAGGRRRCIAQALAQRRGGYR